MKPMPERNQEPSQLLPQRTFVLQLHSGCSARDGELRGRVEHLTSGDSEPFTSLSALLEFIARFEAASA